MQKAIPRFYTLDLSRYINLKQNKRKKQQLEDQFVNAFADLSQRYNGPEDTLQKTKLKEEVFEKLINDNCVGFEYDPKIQPYTRCATSRRCKQHHVLDIAVVFDKIVQQGAKQGCYCTCETAKKQFNLTEIIPDYYSILYLKPSLGMKIKLQFYDTEVGQPNFISHTQIYHKQSKILKTLVDYPYSKQFEDYSKSKNKPQIIKYYKELRRKPNHNGQLKIQTRTVSTISLLSGRRMRSGVLHADCNHPNIYIFDVEEVLIHLHQNQTVGCIYCSSKFTKDNIMDKAVLFEKVSNILVADPSHTGKVHYQEQQKQKNPQQIRILTEARQKMADHNQRDKIIKEKQYINRLETRAKQFWNSQRKETYKKNINKMKIPDVSYFEKRIDYSKLHYPVRCQKCDKPDFIDLWDYLFDYQYQYSIILSSNISTCSNSEIILCSVCGWKPDLEESSLAQFDEPQLYLDLEVFTLMQYGLVNLRFYYKTMKWLPDITNVVFKEHMFEIKAAVEFVVNYLKIHDRVIKSQNKNQFSNYNDKNAKINVENAKSTQCFIIQSCLKYLNCHQHIIYLDKSKNCYDTDVFRCSICAPTQNFSILDLYYDENLSNRIHSNKKKYIAIVKQNIDLKETSEFDYLRQEYKEEFEKLQEVEKKRTDNQDKAWNKNEITEYGGGVYLFDWKVVDDYAK